MLHQVDVDSDGDFDVLVDVDGEYEYEEQVKHGRYSLHKHPAGAVSWREGWIIDIGMLLGVQHVIASMRQFGMDHCVVFTLAAWP